MLPESCDYTDEQIKTSSKIGKRWDEGRFCILQLIFVVDLILVVDLLIVADRIFVDPKKRGQHCNSYPKKRDSLKILTEILGKQVSALVVGI